MSGQTSDDVMRDLRGVAHSVSWSMRRDAEREPMPPEAEPGPLVLSFAATCPHCGGPLHTEGCWREAGGIELSVRVACGDCRASGRIRVMWANGGAAPVAMPGGRAT